MYKFINKSLSAIFRASVTPQSGTAMLFVLVLTVIGGVLMASLNLTSRVTAKTSGNRREKVAALNIAEAGKERFLAKLLHENYTPQPNNDELIYDNEMLGNGTYNVRCITAASTDTLTVRARGEENGYALEIEVVALKQRDVPISAMSAKLPGALTARSDIVLNGTISVDGREYDSLNGLLGPGTYGVHTCATLTVQSASAGVGGNGLAPVSKKHIDEVRTIVCRENAPVPPELNSPEDFLGLPPGSLDAYKVTAAEFTVPFQGLVYVTESVGPVHFGESRGILIVHNETGTASLSTNGGTFKGLIICDYISKINGTVNVTGAIVSISSTEESNFGNGTAYVYYSKQVLDNLMTYMTNIPWKISELSWRELP